MKGKTHAMKCAALGLAAYGLLLWLLIRLESGVEGGQITTLPRALWYSLVTLTTVGYGDLTPLSPGGRVIGIVFMLLSTGLLALLVGVILSAVTGRLFPQARLFLRRREKWYIFSEDNAAARALASHLTDGLVLFLGETNGGAGLAVPMSAEALFKLPCAEAGERCFFAIGDDAAANERAALALSGRKATVYCRGDGPDEALPANVVPFSDAECCARLYWQARPWRASGERAVLIGDGSFARALLVQGMLTAPPDCSFDVFGNWTQWRAEHWALDDAPETSLALRFREDDWRARPDLLRDASRVVLCADGEAANREALFVLRRSYPVRGAVDVKCAGGFHQGYCFGQPEALFTPELVMKQSLNRRARALHELYRDSVDYPVPAWEALSDFLKRSNLAAADHLLTKLRWLLPEEDIREITPRACARAADRFEALSPEERERCRTIEHARWVLFHALDNWRYAPVRDNAAREHPLMVPYEQLNEAERRKDDNAWLQLRALSEKGDECP